MAILHETWFVCWVVPMYTEIFVPRKIWRNKMCTHICANWLEPLIWQHFSTFLLLQRRVSVPINEWVRWRRSKGVNLKSLPLWWKKAITATTFELWQHPGKIRKYILALDHRPGITSLQNKQGERCRNTPQLHILKSKWNDLRCVKWRAGNS